MSKTPITAKELKPALLSYLLYEVHHHAAFTEYGRKGCEGIADVFSVMKSGYTHEFEIKVAQGDLRGELLSIQYWVAQRDKTLWDKPDTSRLSKPTKHHYYLLNNGLEVEHSEQYNDGWRQRPNRFSFVVPSYLANEAVSGVRGTPYGVISYEPDRNKFTVRVRSELLHQNKIRDDAKDYMLRKAAMEVHSLREKEIARMYDAVETNVA